MKPRCDRCHRRLEHVTHLAGMKLGEKCRRAIVDAVLAGEQPQQTGPEPDSRQIDFFQLPDLFGSSPEARG